MFTPLEEKGAMYGMGGVEYETTYVGVKVTFCGCEKLKKFQMVDNATSDKWYEQTGIRMHGILGVDFFRANNMLLDFVNERVIVAPDEFRRAEAS